MPSEKTPEEIARQAAPKGSDMTDQLPIARGIALAMILGTLLWLPACASFMSPAVTNRIYTHPDYDDPPTAEQMQKTFDDRMACRRDVLAEVRESAPSLETEDGREFDKRVVLGTFTCMEMQGYRVLVGRPTLESDEGS